SAFNARAEEGAVFLVEPLALEAPKTKQIVTLLAAMGLPEVAEANVLVLTDGNKPVVHLSARNMERVEVRPFGEESTYDVLWSDVVVIESPALERAAEVAHA